MRSTHRLLVLATTTLLVLSVAPAAQAVDFSIYGSYYETKDLGNTYGAGLRLGLFHRFQLQLAGTFYEGAEDTLRLADPDEQDISVDLTPFDAGFAFHFGPQATGFFLGAGLSYYILEEDRRELDDELGYYGKAGYQWSHFFIEGMYRVIEGNLRDILDGIIGDVDVALEGVTVNVGWRF